MSVNSQEKNQEKDPDPIYVLRSGAVNVTCLKFCVLDGITVLIAANQNGVIQFWDIETKRIIITLQAGDGASLLFVDVIMDDIRTLISHDRNGCVKFWDATEIHGMTERCVWHINKVGFCPVDVLKHDELFWIGFPSNDSDVGIVPFKLGETNKENIKELKPSEKLGMVMRLRLFVRDDNMFVMIGYEDGSLKLWDVMQQSICSSVTLYQDPIMALDVDTRDMKAIVSSVTNKIHVVSIQEDLSLYLSEVIESPASGFSALSIRNDGKIVVVGGWDGKLRIYGLKKMKLLALLKFHTKTMSDVCFSDDKMIASSCNDGRISLWDVYKNT